MSIQGIILIDIVCVGLMLFILNLIRTKKLHVGYAVIWFLALLGLIFMISVPPFLTMLPLMVGAKFPASALSLLAFIFIFVILIFFSMQLSTLAARQVELIQALAIKELQLQEKEKATDSTA